MEEVQYPKLTTIKHKQRFIEFWLNNQFKNISNKSIILNLLELDSNLLISKETNFYSKKISRLNKNITLLLKILDNYQEDNIYKIAKLDNDDKLLKYISVLKMNSVYLLKFVELCKNLKINIEDISQIGNIKWINLNFNISSSLLKKEKSKIFEFLNLKTEFSLKERNGSIFEYSFYFPENSKCVIVFCKTNLSNRFYRCNAEFWYYKRNNIKLIIKKDIIKS